MLQHCVRSSPLGARNKYTLYHMIVHIKRATRWEASRTSLITSPPSHPVPGRHSHGWCSVFSAALDLVTHPPHNSWYVIVSTRLTQQLQCFFNTSQTCKAIHLKWGIKISTLTNTKSISTTSKPSVGHQSKLTLRGSQYKYRTTQTNTLHSCQPSFSLIMSK